MIIYKLLRADEWAALQDAGQTHGAPIDIADGYIHFSTSKQVAETASKYFDGVEGIMLLAYRAEDFGDLIKWEPSRGGALFPHLYAPLPLDAALWAEPLPIGADGHVFPARMDNATE